MYRIATLVRSGRSNELITRGEVTGIKARRDVDSVCSFFWIAMTIVDVGASRPKRTMLSLAVMGVWLCIAINVANARETVALVDDLFGVTIDPDQSVAAIVPDRKLHAQCRKLHAQCRKLHAQCQKLHEQYQNIQPIHGADSLSPEWMYYVAIEHHGNALRKELYEKAAREPCPMQPKERMELDLSFYHAVLAPDDVLTIKRAIEFAALKHAGQNRKPVVGSRCVVQYVLHPMRVALSLLRDGEVRSVNVLVAALLHDTLEDTATTKEEIEEQFGERVRITVEEVTERDKAQQLKKAPQQSLNAQLIKLADRLDNVRDMLRSKPIVWSDTQAYNYCAHGKKLVNALRGTSRVLEQELLLVINLCLLTFRDLENPATTPLIF
jgi:RNA polymerase subunit RPABC4/transcription elongation factor Spt4